MVEDFIDGVCVQGLVAWKPATGWFKTGTISCTQTAVLLVVSSS